MQNNPQRPIVTAFSDPAVPRRIAQDAERLAKMATGARLFVIAYVLRVAAYGADLEAIRRETAPQAHRGDAGGSEGVRE